MNRKKFLCPKQDETLNALIPFEVADVKDLLYVLITD